MSDSALTPAQIALEQEGLGFLRAGKFRKARDAFKVLHKSHPARALPLLIEANLGLANEMIAKGLVSEANQVIAYLKTIAPASANLSLVTAKPADPGDPWAGVVPLAAQRLASTTQPESRIRAADEIILGAGSPAHTDHPDAKAILTAWETGYGSATAARTAELLRAVPRSSPFSHWVMFFKGMTALESGDHARAADCFRRVPECSLLHPSIPALLTLCGAPTTTPPATRTVHALCAWAGHPKLAEPLLRAEPLWRKRHRAKAFTALTKDIPDLFRCGARDFKADLTRFLTTEFARAQSDDTNYVDTLLDYVAVKSRAVASAVLDQAFFAIDFADFSGCAHRHFSAVLAKLEGMHRVSPLSPAMQSRIFTNLAAAYIADVKKHPGDPCSAPNAKKALAQAIKHDPDNLNAWLMQCDLLAMGRDSSAYHRFLDDLTKRFPTHKEVLIRNGDCCAARKSYTKSLRNFESAAKIDSVDPRIHAGILRARLGIAEEAYKKRKPANANWELIETLASTGKSCRESSLWRLRVRRISLEARHAIKDDDLVALAAATLPHAPNAFLLEAACRFAIANHGKTFKQPTLERMFPARGAPESLADFLAIIDETDALAGSTYFPGATNLARDIFVEHGTLLRRYAAERKDLLALIFRILTCPKPDMALASPLIEAWYKRDPADPLVRMICVSYHFRWLQRDLPDDPIALARKLKDSHDPDANRLALLLQQRSSRRERDEYSDGGSSKLDLDYDPHGGDDDEFYDDDDDDDFADDFTGLDRALDKIKPSKLEAIIKAMLAGSGFPGPGANIGPIPYSPAPPRPPAPPKPPRRPRQKPAGPDPRQMTFDAEIIPPPQHPPQP